MKLCLMDGLHSGRIIDIGESGVVIGRDASCDVVFADDGVSRRHAKIYPDGFGFVIEDLNSVNGVRVNGKRIEHRKTLFTNDKIGIDEHVVLFTQESSITSDDRLATFNIPAPAASAESAAPAPAAKSSPIWTAVLAAILLLAAALTVVLYKSRERPASDDNVTTQTDLEDAAPVADVPDSGAMSEADDGELESMAAAESAKGFYCWIESGPPGAKVDVNGNPRGTTPTLLTNLERGRYRLQLTKPGYEGVIRAVRLPVRSGRIRFPLERRKGTALITTDPTGVSVILGTQYAGRTPYLMRGSDPGEYTVKLVEPGYDIVTRKVVITNFRPVDVDVKMTPNTGSLNVVTLPVGAKIYVDGHFKGNSRAESDHMAQSRPVPIHGLLAREDHPVYIEHMGAKSVVKRVKVMPGAMTSVKLMVWIRNTLVKTIDGKTWFGMLKRRNALGDIVLGITPSRDITLVATQILEVRPLAEDEFRHARNEHRGRQER